MCLEIVACICPPLAVCWRKGCGVELFAAFFLTILGWLPGCCYACCIINQKKSEQVHFHQTMNVSSPVTSPPQHVTVNINDSGRQQQYPYPMTHQPYPGNQGQQQYYSPPQGSNQEKQQYYSPPEAPSAPMPNAPPPYSSN